MADIAVDIDNTLYSFEYAARQVYLDLAEAYGDKSLFKGAYNPWQEWRSMTDICGAEICGEVIARVHSPEIIVEQQPFERSEETLREAVEDGHRLRYISNRASEAYDATASWLFEVNDFPRGELVCTMEDKIPLVRDCQYIIDDRPKTLVQFVYDFTWKYSHGSTNQEKKRVGFGMAFPFNQALTDIPDVYLAPTWGGIHYYLKRERVIRDVLQEEFAF